MYTLNQVVSTPKGKGTVVYVEDDYIEVDVGGVEMGFEYPFSALGEWKEPEPLNNDRLAPSAPTPEYDAVLAFVEAEDPLAMMLARGIHAKTTLAVRMTGGEAGAWDDLNSFQKLNFLKIAAGISIEDIMAQVKEHSEG